MLKATKGSPTPIGSVGYAGIFVVGFGLVLTIALAAALVGAPWRTWFPGAEGERSLVGDVKSAVYTFMSHLV
jgi:light-harvesting complex 1 beta chain